MRLTEFVLARIAEDEAAVEGFWSGDGDPDFMWGPGRIRVECEAKRRIVERAHLDGFDRGEWGDGQSSAYDEVARILAAVYADHDDYDESWRP